MDLPAIQQAILELENDDPTVDTVKELACLYIVREHLISPNSSHVAKELNEILPFYSKYCETKRKYQLHELTEDAVLKDMDRVCKELKEFITTLYSCTDFYRERKILLKTLEDLDTQLNRLEDTL